MNGKSGDASGPRSEATPSGEKVSPATSQPPAASHDQGHQSFWLWIMCLTGVDYFSTLGYQPSIAFEAAGLLAPLATVLLVLITLFGALPIYSHVAKCSPLGQGSVAMLERLMYGWTGKISVLVLLGFAATDFVITKTLSAADAAVHLIHNPLWFDATPSDTQRIVVTVALLILLGVTFMRGFKEVIGLAVVIVAVYLVLNVIVIGSGLFYLFTHGNHFSTWWTNVLAGNWHIEHSPLSGTGWGVMIATCVLIFPKLALGLSGFETGVAVMPLIRGSASDDPHQPAVRIRNTRKLLVTAAAIMSVLLLGSSLVTATLIEPAALLKADEALGRPAGLAAERALAYLAHGQSGLAMNPLFGEIFGTIYDISTIVILGFAGASAMAGLLNLVPQYLPRYGMAPEWARAVRPLVILFTIINLFVTWVFNADVTAQGGAYATGVLVLICSACVASVIDCWRAAKEKSWLARIPWGFCLITVLFAYTTLANMIERPDGIKIALCFIAAIVVSSFGSRLRRSTELRFVGFEFKDDQSRFLWDSLRFLEFPVLVPHRPGGRDLLQKDQNIRERHRLAPEVPIVFVEAELGDPSEFTQKPLLEIHESEGRFVIGVTRCVSIAHVVAKIALDLSSGGKPPEIHFGWSDESPMAASFSFLLFGQGNVPWMVRELIRRAEPNPERQPQVFIG